MVAALDADERSGCIGVLPIKTTRFEQFLSLADSRKLTVESVGEGASGDIVALLDRYDVVAFLPIAAALDSHHDGGPDHQGLEVKGTLMRDVASHCSGKPSLVVGFEGVPEHKDHSGSTLGKLRGLLSKSGAVVCSITAGVPSNLLLSIALFQAIPKRRFMLPL